LLLIPLLIAMMEHPMRFPCCVLRPLAVAVVLACPPVAVAAEPATAAKTAAPSGDEAAIRSATAAYRKALAGGDIDAISAFWAPEADYVDQLGRAYKVHAGAIRAKRLSQEAGHIAHLAPKMDTGSIRFVTADVAIEDGAFERPGVESGQSPFGRYSAVWVKRNGKWLIDGVRESPVRLEASANTLQGLEWMIGDWAGEGPQATAEISCSWGQDKTYILAQLKMQPRGDKPVSATQLIGWDPIEQRVRSFLFDSRGGFTEGTWTNEGDAWNVRNTAVLPDGKRVVSTKLFSRIDDNTAVWESLDESDGQLGTDMRLRMTRNQNKK
jgi:ketosteroid isomerase-like protein